jgi:hypothetical protein
MRKIIALCTLLAFATALAAGTKDSGATTLKDVQPFGTTDKQHKHQQYDLSFQGTSGRDYTCRTKSGDSIKATDIVVGSNITYEVNGDKGKVKITGGKQFSCTVVRVASSPATPAN